MKEKTTQYLHLNLFLRYTIIFILPMLISCAGKQYDLQPLSENNRHVSYTDEQKNQNKIRQLQLDLTLLDNNIDMTEAKELAETSINYSLLLADEYRLVRPPYLHNILVRLRIKDRGLCYHWTDDLITRLATLELKGFTLHRGVAHKGSDLREHNSVVVTARGQDFYDGIVLDPWRDSGDLFWVRVKADRYPWEER